MTSAWLLPEHIADVLPSQARRLEELRRTVLDRARAYGYELVMPPLIEHLESLLTGTGHELELRTFKLVDQSSGRTLGLRADTTPQVARIDAHLLNRAGVTRLCYCGAVVHARPAGLQATREPLQFGAELYGHPGLEADLEIQDLALDSLRAARLGGATGRSTESSASRMRSWSLSTRAETSASLLGKYWYSEPMLTPAACAMRLVLARSYPSSIRTREVALMMPPRWPGRGPGGGGGEGWWSG